MSRPRLSEAKAPRRQATGPARHLAASARTDIRALCDLLPNHPEAWALARAHAARRGLTLEQLLRRVLETILEDDLVGAVLDDAETMEGQA
ncbi:hypothetical protein GCM10011390_10420 [Aureimonas endophytica]|uniref:Uncharacterized protein n=1 Tax=Aureimonas endophytica TaxID=2027858 RepID=A0A916ZG75_9HYPH|nr:hypothetical protein [Aureimonas endophytica]GGD93577.1 hypothetical protein GCM10011390_10420 [Aureimonas endophytica]